MHHHEHPHSHDNPDIEPTDFTYNSEVFNQFDMWLTFGMQQGWIGPPLCHRHGPEPLTDEEEENGEICVSYLRLYPNSHIRRHVEARNENSDWRSLRLPVKVIKAHFSAGNINGH